MASLTDVISAEAAEMLARRLKIELVSEGYSSVAGASQLTLVVRLLLDETVISESAADLHLSVQV